MTAGAPMTEYSSLSTPDEFAGVEFDRAAAPITLESPAVTTRSATVLTTECGEPLVAADGSLACINAYRVGGWPGTDHRVWLRSGVVDRLLAAERQLPNGFAFAIFDGWRSAETIRALYHHFYGPGSTLAPGFLADPDDPTRIPPHGTGGAVDLTLSWQGAPLSLGTPFDEFTDRAHLEALEASGPEDHLSRDLRRLLFHTMTSHGFAPYAEEWWHFSHGDVAWALADGEAIARYGPTSPEHLAVHGTSGPDTGDHG